MNKETIFSGEAQLVARAIDALHGSVGIQGELLDTAPLDADATVLLIINGHRLEYDCQVKKKIDRYTLPFNLANKLGNARPALLVTSSLSKEMANRCRELGLQFIDTAGNAYITDGAAIYIHVTGLRSEDKLQAPTSHAMTLSVLRMMFAFLAEPALLNALYRDISNKAGVSIGAIGKAFETLETRKLIGTTASGKRKRMIRTPELFLNEWASGYTGRLKPKLRTYRFATDNLDKFIEIWRPGFRVSAWSGEAAAMQLTGHLKPEECTLYVNMNEPGALRDIVKDFRLRADPQGRIEIVEMFWDPADFSNSFPTVPPHLVYADLMATHDARNIAVARQIAATVIDHVHNTPG
jgi:hypothetical protein